MRLHSSDCYPDFTCTRSIQSDFTCTLSVQSPTPMNLSHESLLLPEGFPGASFPRLSNKKIIDQAITAEIVGIKKSHSSQRGTSASGVLQIMRPPSEPGPAPFSHPTQPIVPCAPCHLSPSALRA